MHVMIVKELEAWDEQKQQLEYDAKDKIPDLQLSIESKSEELLQFSWLQAPAYELIVSFFFIWLSFDKFTEGIFWCSYRL